MDDMADLRERLRKASAELERLASEARSAGDHHELARLRGKNAGVLLALDYTRAYS